MDTQSEKKQNFLNGVIDSFEDTMAVIKTQDGQTLRWPKNNLPDEYKQGSSIKLTIASSLNEKIKAEHMAKTILNELLKKN